MRREISGHHKVIQTRSSEKKGFRKDSITSSSALQDKVDIPFVDQNEEEEINNILNAMTDEDLEIVKTKIFIVDEKGYE